MLSVSANITYIPKLILPVQRKLITLRFISQTLSVRERKYNS